MHTITTTNTTTIILLSYYYTTTITVIAYTIFTSSRFGGMSSLWIGNLTASRPEHDCVVPPPAFDAQCLGYLFSAFYFFFFFHPSPHYDGLNGGLKTTCC